MDDDERRPSNDDWDSPLRDLLERVERTERTDDGRTRPAADKRTDLGTDEEVHGRWRPERFRIDGETDADADGDATDGTFVWVRLGGSGSIDEPDGAASDHGLSLELGSTLDDAGASEDDGEGREQSVDESDDSASAFSSVLDRLDGTASATDPRSPDDETDLRSPDDDTDAVPDAVAPDTDAGVANASAGDAPSVAEGGETAPVTDLSVDLASAVDDHTSSLLLGPLNGETTARACSDLLEPPGGGEYNLLLVCITESPHDRLATIRRYGRSFPENVRVVTVDDDVTNPDTNTTVTIQGSERTIDIKTVTNPSNLSRLGIMISKHLSEWEDTEVPTMVCLHSLSALLQYVSPKQLFQFSHLLQNRLRGFDATVHFHVDPGVHDDVTLTQLEPLAERKITVDDRGTITVD